MGTKKGSAEVTVLPNLESSKPRFQFTDDELIEFEILILSLLEKAREEFSTLFSQVNHSTSEEDVVQIDFQKSRIKQLEIALRSVYAKTFGKCNCFNCKGKIMNKDRMKKVPTARMCVASQQNR